MINQININQITRQEIAMNAMNSIIKTQNKPLFDYEITGLKNSNRLQVLWMERMGAIKPFVLEQVIFISEVIENTRPTRLPMVWSMYPERLWDPKYCCEPTVTISMAKVSSTYYEVIYGDNDLPLGIDSTRTTIYVTCEPTIEAYRRWSSVIIDDFYRAMRAVRNAFSVGAWYDRSKTRVTHSWERVTLRYISRSDLIVMKKSRPTPIVDAWGGTYSETEDHVQIVFELQIPDDRGEKQASGCRVVEVVETRMVTERVRKIACE